MLSAAVTSHSRLGVVPELTPPLVEGPPVPPGSVEPLPLAGGTTSTNFLMRGKPLAELPDVPGPPALALLIICATAVCVPLMPAAAAVWVALFPPAAAV